MTSHWMTTALRLGTACLTRLPAERAHDFGMWCLERGLMDFAPASGIGASGLATNIPGIGPLAHPIGLAAGFDKNARCPGGFARMGFAFLEVGTVTPKSQLGNPKPRLFRQREQRALINRMGFNNDGAAVVSERLRSIKWNHDKTPLGVNLGKNKNTPTEEALIDYVTCYEAFRGLASYYVINISSPNTPNLRELANPEFVVALAAELGAGELAKIWIKLDPDLPRDQFQELIRVIAERGFQGVVLSNTHKVNWPEQGGQSGHPLMSLATARLEWAYEVHRGKLPMIASGGILSGVDVVEKLIRGALAVQIYTALAYGGPYTVMRLIDETARELSLRGYACLEEAIGTYYQGQK